MTKTPIDIFRQIADQTKVRRKDKIEAFSLGLAHSLIATYARMGQEALEQEYLAIALRTGIDFSIPSQELFRTAEQLCDAFLEGHVSSDIRRRLTILIHDEASKFGPVLSAIEKGAGNYTQYTRDTNIIVATQFPAQYLDKITSHLDSEGHVNYSGAVRELARHYAQTIRDRRFSPPS